ncbi:MAG: VOC family protein [Bacteroidota bacterium]|nr:VOC family protein [Bacteroidota bacterium]
MSLTLHHIGCLVNNIENAIADYQILHPEGEISEIYDIEAQKVKVCFFSMGAVHMEFVAPYGPPSFLLERLKNNPGFYHIGVYVDNIDAEIDRLEEEGYRLINKFISVAFDNRHCAFLLNKERHMIELIERG